MAKRNPPAKVVAFPIWRTHNRQGPGMMEVTEHPDTGQWWIRHSVQQRVPTNRSGRIEMIDVWVWTGWAPARMTVRIDRTWKMQRPNYPGSLHHRKGRYKKAMLPVETVIPT